MPLSISITITLRNYCDPSCFEDSHMEDFDWSTSLALLSLQFIGYPVQIHGGDVADPTVNLLVAHILVENELFPPIAILQYGGKIIMLDN